MTDASRIEHVLDFWLGPIGADGRVEADRPKQWFKEDAKLDRDIGDRFGDWVEGAARDELEHWRGTARGTLALIVVCDQFPRNMYRGTPRAWALDAKAQSLTTGAVDAGTDRELRIVERAFFYMPLMHAEDLDLQDRSVALFAALEREAPAAVAELASSFHYHARKHRDVIARFGRFPHRNVVLGRDSTDEEQTFLAAGKPFG